MGKARKGNVDLVLSHPGNGSEVTVRSPARIVLSWFQAVGVYRYGLVPLDVTPVDWMGFVRVYGPLLMVAIAVALKNVGILVAVVIVALFDMLRVTRTYYRDVIRRRLALGYTLKDPAQEELLKESGTLPLPATSMGIKKYIRPGVYVVLLVVMLMVSGGNGAVDFIKNSHLNLNGLPDMTVGEAAETNLVNPEWSSFDGNDGLIYVNLQGSMQVSDRLMPVLYQFAVPPTDLSQFKLTTVEFNNEPMNGLLLSSFVYMLFGVQ